MAKDLYEILGVSKDASEQDIKKAYRKLAMQYHPDRFTTASEQEKKDAEAKFKEINHAYEVLSDKDKKANYDQFGSEDGPQGFGGFGGAQDFGGFEDILSSFFGGFGGGRSNRPNAPKAGADINVRLDLTFEEAYFGVKKTIDLVRDEECPTCHGSGAKDNSSIEVCPYCKGTGYVRKVQNSIFGQQVVQTVCTHCGGKGKVIKDKCKDCKGAGYTRKKASITVNIPAGIDSGMSMTIRNEGNAGKNGGPKGNLIISISVKPSMKFKRINNDLHIDLPVTFYDAAYGAKKRIMTPKGETIVKFDGGTQNGTKIRVKGYGMKILQKESYGDLYVTIKVETPHGLNRKQLSLLEEFQNSLSESQQPNIKAFNKNNI